MELLRKDEVHYIIKQLGYNKALNWRIEDYSDELIGYLGEHLKLTIEAELNSVKKQVKLFVKCLPRTDQWKANYLREMSFFKKEYVMLSKLFKQFHEGAYKWRPTLLYIKEELFVFEDVTELGYKMPSNRDTFTLELINAGVVTMANFHAQSYIYEEQRSKNLNRPYRIWEEYSEYLQEPMKNLNWRNAGRNAAIDYLKAFSKHRKNPTFLEKVSPVVNMLFDKALMLMKPSSVYRNTVVHRDLWTNNIFFRTEADGSVKALFVDFQTVLYSSPMLDLSSFIYFNTTGRFRERQVEKILDLYHEVLSETLRGFDVDINEIMDRDTLRNCYEESILFALTQAALIVPIVAMDIPEREKIFCNPETGFKVNEVSRSEEFIEVALHDDHYRKRVCDVLDEIVERYIISGTF